MKSHIKIYLLVCIAALLLTGCDTVFDVHPYDVRVKGETNLNAKNIQKIEQTVKSKDTIRFAVISDSHQWYDDLQKAVNDINSRQDSIDFVIHCGDISDFGATREMKWTREKMQKLKMPSVVLLGNHDCLGTGNQTYEAIYGNPDFSFIAGKVKFVCLNTNAIEYDYSRPVPNFDFQLLHPRVPSPAVLPGRSRSSYQDGRPLQQRHPVLYGKQRTLPSILHFHHHTKGLSC